MHLQIQRMVLRAAIVKHFLGFQQKTLRIRFLGLSIKCVVQTNAGTTVSMTIQLCTIHMYICKWYIYSLAYLLYVYQKVTLLVNQLNLNFK